MRHLIVEACVTRGLLAANLAYFWLGPGGSLANISSAPPQPSPWSAFMDGAPLSGPLKAALMACPAGRYAYDKFFKNYFLNSPSTCNII